MKYTFIIALLLIFISGCLDNPVMFDEPVPHTPMAFFKPGSSVVYDFNHLAGNDIAYFLHHLNGQDNWISDGYMSDFHIGVTGTLGFDGTKSLLFDPDDEVANDEGTSASRLNDDAFSFPWSSIEDIEFISIQADFLVGRWVNLFALGYDIDANGKIDSPGEIGPQIGIGPDNDIGVVVNLAGTGYLSNNVSITEVDGEKGDWVRLKLVMDLYDNDYTGSGSVYYQNLTKGDNALQLVPGLEYVSLGLDHGANNAQNPANWNGMWIEMIGRGNGLDNIVIAYETFDDDDGSDDGNGDSSDPGNGDDTERPARELLEEITDELHTLHDSLGDDRTRERLKKPISQLEAAKSPRNWLQGQQKPDPKEGKTVFNETGKAVEELRKIINDKRTPPEIRQILLNLLQKITVANRNIADVSLQDLLKILPEDVRKKVELWLQGSLKEFQKGDENLSENKHREAIHNYRKAWERSIRAEKEINKHAGTALDEDETELPAMEIIEDVLDELRDLHDLLEDDDAKIARKLVKPISQVEAAREHFEQERLDHIKERKKVFDETGKAVQELQKISDAKGTPSGISDILRPIPRRITVANRNIADVSIKELQAELIDEETRKKVEDKIEKSIKEFQKGEEELIKGKFKQAIDKFKKAWEHSLKAEMEHNK